MAPLSTQNKARTHGLESPLNLWQLLACSVFTSQLAMFWLCIFPIEAFREDVGIANIVVYVVTTISTTVAFFVTSLIDPADESLKAASCASGEDYTRHCPVCAVNVHETSRHCSKCCKCVP